MKQDTGAEDQGLDIIKLLFCSNLRTACVAACELLIQTNENSFRGAIRHWNLMIWEFCEI